MTNFWWSIKVWLRDARGVVAWLWKHMFTEIGLYLGTALLIWLTLAGLVLLVFTWVD